MLFKSEAEVKAAVPRFFESYLGPHKARLERRASIVRSNRSDWWGLMEPRSWSTKDVPRIISKFFGGEGAFFCDLGARYIPVMGHIWQIKPDAIEMVEEDMLPLSELLAAYAALFNSEPFLRILSFYSPHVAGGQFDLSSRHVTPIPVPNLRELSADPERGRVVTELAFHGRSVNVRDPEWRARTAQLVTGLYGTPSLTRL